MVRIKPRAARGSTAAQGPVRGEVSMQFHPGKYRNFLQLKIWVIGGLLVALGCAAPHGDAQFTFGREATGGRARIAGSVMLDEEAQPAARVRVEVKALAGGDIATTFTDASG